MKFKGDNNMIIPTDAEKPVVKVCKVVDIRVSNFWLTKIYYIRFSTSVPMAQFT